MEKESSRPLGSPVDFQRAQGTTEFADWVENLPVPNQLPKPPDLSHLPSDILRSSTVETLIHQNEDLLSRLSISLRRNSQLEENIAQLEKNHRILQHRFSNQEDQLLVLKNKDSLIQNKYVDYETKIDQLKKDLKLFEIQYAELYATSQSQISSLKEKVLAFSKRVGRYARFRNRLRDLYKRSQKLQRELSHDNSRLLSQVALLTETQASLKKNLSVTLERLNTSEKRHSAEIADITARYEADLGETRQALQKASTELSEARQCFEKNIELENAVVLKDRKIQQLKTEHSTELELVKNQLVEQRKIAKENLVRSESLSLEIEELKDLIKAEKIQSSRLTDQVESLQILWRETNQEMEKLKQKNESLQKLNQQISVSLNENRRLLKLEKERNEGLTFSSNERISTLETQVNTLSSGVAKETSEASPNSRIKPQVIHHLQALIAEVQSGVDTTTSRSTDSATSPSSID